MIELPEAQLLTRQIAETLIGRRIQDAVAGQSPHGFAFYCGDPTTYGERLVGKSIAGAEAHGGHVWMELSDGHFLIFGEGASLRFLAPEQTVPKKHQLLLTFEDQSRFLVTVQMYAFLVLHYPVEELNPYIECGLRGPNPLDDSFDESFFLNLIATSETDKLTTKGLLATDQRLPGIGNGVLQDILFHARVNPRRLVNGLTSEEKTGLYISLRNTLSEMIALGGRNTERDLFGVPGGYETKMSRNTVGKPCPRCGSVIVKETYLGGSVYYCPACQPKA